MLLFLFYNNFFITPSPPFFWGGVYSVRCGLTNFWVNYLKPTLINYFSFGSPETKFERNGWKRKLLASFYFKVLIYLKKLFTMFSNGIN